MKETSKSYYQCELCGNMSTDYDEIKECEENCKKIYFELKNIIDSCNKLNELGCTIELREFPFYPSDKLDINAIRILKKEYKLAFKDENTLLIETPNSIKITPALHHIDSLNKFLKGE